MGGSRTKGLMEIGRKALQQDDWYQFLNLVTVRYRLIDEMKSSGELLEPGVVVEALSHEAAINERLKKYRSELSKTIETHIHKRVASKAYAAPVSLPCSMYTYKIL